MLAKTGDIPVSSGWLFEPKLDGSRCLVCTHGKLTVLSRRGWNMTPLLPELDALPDDLQLDGELVALDEKGGAGLHLLSSRVLHKRDGIAVTFFVFDVLAVEGMTTT